VRGSWHNRQLRTYAPAAAVIFLCAGIFSCNPFAPQIDNSLSQKSFGDPHTDSGFFDAFRYAYLFKDTTFYGKLLAPNFVFSYRNYDRGLDLEWGRDEEMQTTGSLFASSESLNLLWGDILDSSVTDTVEDITRSFSLDITLTSGEPLHVDGRAIFTLARAIKSDPWQAIRWRDESNF
jgi:hypothetical protein